MPGNSVSCPRRRLMTLALSGAAVLMLAACSSAAPEAPTAAPPPPPQATSVPAVVAPTLALTPTPALIVPAPPAAAPTSSSSAAPAGGGSADGAADVAAMAQAWSAAQSYRMTVQVNQQASPASVVIEVVKPDRQRTKMSVGSQNIEVIRIGQDTYANLTGQWIKSSGTTPLPQVMAGLSDPAQIVGAFAAAAQQGQTVTRGAVDTINGDQCQEWQASNPNAGSAGSICIGLTDKLPRQMKVGTGQATITFSDWNSPITIAPPI